MQAGAAFASRPYARATPPCARGGGQHTRQRGCGLRARAAGAAARRKCTGPNLKLHSQRRTCTRDTLLQLTPSNEGELGLRVRGGRLKPHRSLSAACAPPNTQLCAVSANAIDDTARHQ